MGISGSFGRILFLLHLGQLVLFFLVVVKCNTERLALR